MSLIETAIRELRLVPRGNITKNPDGSVKPARVVDICETIEIPGEPSIAGSTVAKVWLNKLGGRAIMGEQLAVLRLFEKSPELLKLAVIVRRLKAECHISMEDEECIEIEELLESIFKDPETMTWYQAEAEKQLKQ